MLPFGPLLMYVFHPGQRDRQYGLYQADCRNNLNPVPSKILSKQICSQSAQLFAFIVSFVYIYRGDYCEHVIYIYTYIVFLRLNEAVKQLLWSHNLICRTEILCNQTSLDNNNIWLKTGLINDKG